VWAGSSGTAGKIFVGTSTGTLTAAQLAQIQFDGFTGIPIILIATGEIVPRPSTPLLTITGTTDHGSSCVGTAATTIHYTLTNSGAAPADGISVVSDNTEFVVSNLSDVTIPVDGSVNFRCHLHPKCSRCKKCNNYSYQYNWRRSGNISNYRNRSCIALDLNSTYNTWCYVLGNGTQTLTVTATAAGIQYSWTKDNVPVINGGVYSGQGNCNVNSY
jgi:hypothetical protein